MKDKNKKIILKEDIKQEFYRQKDFLEYSQKHKNRMFAIYNELYFYLITKQISESDKKTLKAIIKLKDIFKSEINKFIKQEQIRKNTNEKNKIIYKSFKTNNVL